ncbi:MAG TPA: G1 family glutamic endopeptidase [Solirubrobacteraceae bacterium]|nr:G1 family glutamic endopeptidase [Solirubrobacteraceae bacterium]
MKLKRVIPLFAATAACTLGAVPMATAATDVQQASSENWSGYVAGGANSSTQFKSVSGSWVAPTANCTQGQAYSAFWVGLGGAGQNHALEQAGTEADCSSGGAASYFAWYELVPAAPVKINMAIHPGDHMFSRVTVSGSNVTIALSDQTTGASFNRTLQMSNPDVSSAEWIAEAPSQCAQTTSDCTPLSLADFGKVTFTGASATTVGGHTGTISDPAWSASAVTLSPSASGMGFASYSGGSATGSAGATPSGLSTDGSSFSVSWTPASTDVSGSAGGGSGYGYGAGGYGPGGYGYGDGGYGGYGAGGYGYGGGGYIYPGDGGFIYIPGIYSLS